ncbi:hypothetical protein D3C76_1540830 [compost metagenome]
MAVVVDEVADYLDPGAADRAAEHAAQHVEVAVDAVAGDQVGARFDDRVAVALDGQAGFDGGEDLVVVQGQGVDVRTVEEIDVDGLHG